MRSRYLLWRPAPGLHDVRAHARRLRRNGGGVHAITGKISVDNIPRTRAKANPPHFVGVPPIRGRCGVLVKLKAWCQEHHINYSELGRRIGAKSPETVRRYAEGRVPASKAIGRIYLATGGAVTPNDFYDLPSLPATDAQEAA